MNELTKIDMREMVLRLAHEIRNPLATIKSGIQLVQHLLPPDAEVKEYLQAALVEVERINRTVSDMQRVIRLDLATARATPIAEIVDEALSRCAAAATEAKVTVECPGNTTSHVLADPSQMIEAITELVGNAINFSPPGSTIGISCVSTTDQMVRIDVIDACGGISPSTAQRMFHPFYSTSTHGTGLGLNIVQRICELGGGRLQWENLADRSGCRFSIFMPEV